MSLRLAQEDKFPGWMLLFKRKHGFWPIGGGSADDVPPPGSTEDGEDEDEDDKSGDGKPSGKPVEDPDKKRLSDEAARHRVRAKEAETRLQDVERELRELRDKGKPEEELKAQRLKELEERVPKLEKENATLRTDNQRLSIETQVLKQSDVKFRDPEVALELLMKRIEMPDEGDLEESAIKDAVKALAKDKPFLVSDGEGENGDGKREKKGPPSSGPDMNRRTQKGGIDKVALEKRFPALRGRV